MSDYKTRYSIASNTYIKKTVPENHLDQERYQRSKERELCVSILQRVQRHQLSD